MKTYIKYLLFLFALIGVIVITSYVTYHYYPNHQKVVNIVYRDNVIYDDSCLNRSIPTYKPTEARKYYFNVNPLTTQKNVTVEPNKGYYLYSDNTLRPVGSRYSNEPSYCAKMHNRSLC